MIHSIRLFCFILLLFVSSVAYPQGSDSLQLEPFAISELSLALEETDQNLNRHQNELIEDYNPEKLILEFRELKKDHFSLRKDTGQSIFLELNLTELNDRRLKWNEYRKKVEAVELKALEISQKSEKFKENLSNYKLRWDLTRIEIDSNELQETFNDRLGQLDGHLDAYQEFYEKHLSETFVLIDTIAEEKHLMSMVLDKINATEKIKQESMLKERSLGFFDMLNDSNTSEKGMSVANSIRKTIRINVEFVRSYPILFIFHLSIFLLLLFGFWRTREDLNSNTNYQLKTFRLLLGSNYQYLLAALIVSFFLSFWIYPARPFIITEQLLFGALICTFVIILQGIQGTFRWWLGLLMLLFIFEQGINVVEGNVYVQRVLMMWESLIAVISTIYMSLPHSPIYSEKVPKQWRFLTRLFPIVPLLFILSIYFNLEGMVELSKLINSFLVKAAGTLVVLVFMVWFTVGLVDYLSQSSLSEYSFLLKKRRDPILKWVRLIARYGAIYLFFRGCLRLLQLLDRFEMWWNDFLSISWEFGQLILSVDLILDFSIILLFFAVLANLSRVLLEVEILPRFNFKKGVPMAIALMTRYVLLLMGFFMAVAAAGISLDRLGFLAGALGVGIGFGLQNVVGNFVSGLILIFERPIHIGDVIVTGNIEGVVEEVGIRSSRILTWDGAEVIVPNNDLISQQVTNWTLSDTKRRRELILKIELGTDPQDVINVISQVLDQDEQILKEPKYMVLFLGFKEYSLDFRVLYWLNENLLSGDSSMALQIHKKLSEAGINLAFPKQQMIVENGKDEMKGN